MSKLPLKLASECSECPECGEAWCDECQEHYAECEHPGPHSEEEDGEWSSISIPEKKP